MPTTLHENRPSAGIGVVEVKKPMVFPISNMPARPSAGIGVVEVQKPMVFCDFQHARATLCGDRRGRGARFFCDFCGARATLCGDRRGRGAKTRGFLRFLRCSRSPLRLLLRTGPRELSRGSRACSRNRRVAGSIPPWSAGGRRKMQLAFFLKAWRRVLPLGSLELFS